MKKMLFRDTTDLMVYSHEPWLEMAGSHGHEGEDMELQLKWGHNMRPDGLARRDGLDAFVVHPAGGREELAVVEGCADYHMVRSARRLTAFITWWPGTWAATCWTGTETIFKARAGSTRRRLRQFYTLSTLSVSTR